MLFKPTVDLIFPKKSQRIQDAVAKLVEEGKVMSYDMLKMKGTQDVVFNGAASTDKIADAIIAKL